MLNGYRIKEERLRKGYSQEELGKLIGVSKVTICGYEKGTRTPNLQYFQKLVKYLEVSPNYLLGYDTLIVSEEDTPYQISLSKEDIIILNELKKNERIYNIICSDPKRKIELLIRNIK